LHDEIKKNNQDIPILLLIRNSPKRYHFSTIEESTRILKEKSLIKFADYVISIPDLESKEDDDISLIELTKSLLFKHLISLI